MKTEELTRLLTNKLIDRGDTIDQLVGMIQGYALTGRDLRDEINTLKEEHSKETERLQRSIAEKQARIDSIEASAAKRITELEKLLDHERSQVSKYKAALANIFDEHDDNKGATKSEPSEWRLIWRESPAHNGKPVREADNAIMHYPTREAAEAAILKGLDAGEFGGEYKVVEVES